MTIKLDAEVIIVGAGPVGLVAAIDLDKRGISTVVVETRAFLDPPSVKCNHVSARTMERFRGLGLAERVRESGLPRDYPQDISFRTTMTGAELARIAIPASRDRYTSTEGPDTSWATPEPPHRINQTYLEPILAEHAAKLARVTLLHRTRFHRATQDAHAVEARISDLDGGNPRTLRGKFLIGADGARSTVRRQIGAALHGDAVLSHVQSTHIKAPDLYARMPGDPAWGYYTFNPRRNGHAYAIDGVERFLVHTYLTAEEAGSGSIDRDESIRTILGVDASFEYEILSREDWIARRLVADRFRLGRVFIAGDSCHLWVPYAGYGMNAGIADGLNLTWALGAHLSGWAEEGILDAYEAERMPITDQVSRFAMGHQRKIAESSIPDSIEDDTPEGAAARARIGREAYELNVQQFAAAGLNFGYVYDTSPIVIYDGADPPPYTMGDYRPSTVPGCRVPHLWLDDGTSLYDRLGTGYTLICLGAPSAIQPFADALRAARIPLSVVEVPAGVAGPEYQHDYLLCREDQHVAWRGNATPDPVDEVIDRLRGGHRADAGRQVATTMAAGNR